jgi:hypothetical protein
MATKASFTPEEWQRLLDSPLLAGMAVTAADPSGLIGLVQEGFAASRALAEAKAADLKPKAIAALREVASLLDAKAPEDAQAFKSWLEDIARRVAEAAKEGGFLGFGGVQVSEAEKATLTEIAAALNRIG